MADLPCHDFNSRRTMLRRIDQIEDAQPGVIFAAKANRRNREIVDLEFTNLTPAQLADLRALWADGAGAIVSFPLTLPGESQHQYIFEAGDLRIEEITAVGSTARLRLIDVTRYF